MKISHDQTIFDFYQEKEIHHPELKVLVSSRKTVAKIPKNLHTELCVWQLAELKNKEASCHYFQTNRGHLLILAPEKEVYSNSSDLIPEAPSLYRDLMGHLQHFVKITKTTNFQLYFSDLDKNSMQMALRGVGLCFYSFKHPIPTELKWNCFHNGKLLKKNELTEVHNYALASSLTRDLVNQPANVLNPKSYSEEIISRFKKLSHCKVKIYSASDLEKKGHHLILAVGQGALHAPRIVEIQYTPPGTSSHEPIIFLGKGVTFDSGGLDLKPADGMRLMKKDMGGSATVAGLALYSALNRVKKKMVFYLCLAENAVSEKSYHPGDIFTDTNGKKVEIHNTDAEGRLVLASGMLLAQNQYPKAKTLIDVATLTGAMRVSLGHQISGFLSNSKKLVSLVNKSAQKSGEPCWQLPLYRPYLSSLKSHVADLVNSASGHGGAITAALFLEQFLNHNLEWIHFDIYGHSENPSGAITEVGANSQPLGMLIELTKNL